MEVELFEFLGCATIPGHLLAIEKGMMLLLLWTRPTGATTVGQGAYVSIYIYMFTIKVAHSYVHTYT